MKLYSNWPALCTIGEDHPQLMEALEAATDDPDTEHNKRLIAAFPECFSKTPVKGPVPFSLVVDWLRALNEKDEPVTGIQTDLVQREIIQGYGVPLKHFAFTKADVEARRREGLDHELVPKHLASSKNVGEVVEYNGGKWVVVQWSRLSNEVSICPIEYLNPDV